MGIPGPMSFLGWVCLVPGPFQRGGYVQDVGISRGRWVCPGGRYVWREVGMLRGCVWGWVCPGGTQHGLLLTPGGGRHIWSASGQYASYWNAFLLLQFLDDYCYLVCDGISVSGCSL